MKNDLTISEFIVALRAKAKSINERADALERDWSELASEVKSITPTAPAQKPQVLDRPVTVEELKAEMKEGKGRAKHFAQRLGTSEAVILALVRDPANDIDDSDRGWLKIVPKFH